MNGKAEAESGTGVVPARPTTPPFAGWAAENVLNVS
jgi:hypothetical protein